MLRNWYFKKFFEYLVILKGGIGYFKVCGLEFLFYLWFGFSVCFFCVLCIWYGEIVYDVI